MFGGPGRGRGRQFETELNSIAADSKKRLAHRQQGEENQAKRFKLVVGKPSHGKSQLHPFP
jgi:hypothetical protein